MYTSTKTYGHEVGLSCCFRQWRASSHCKLLHGYAISVRFEFEATELDERNWVVDFGGLKTLKDFLVKTFDHTLIVADDDPQLAELQRLDELGLARVIHLEHVGCEQFAKYIYETGQQWLVEMTYSPRVRLAMVEVKEHGANSAIYRKERNAVI